MNCHICNQHADSFVDEKSNIKYYHCKDCEYIFKDTSYYKSIKDQKSRYDLHTNSEEDQGYIDYFNRFLDFIKPYLHSDISSALDFGCGRSKLLCSLLSKYNIDCSSYDPIYHPDGMEFGKTYDLILSTEVFEHLHDPKSVFSKLSEMLNNKGILAIQTQFHANNIYEFKNWYYHKDETHIVFFRPQTFHVLAKEFGFKVLEDNSKNMVILQKN